MEGNRRGFNPAPHYVIAISFTHFFFVAAAAAAAAVVSFSCTFDAEALEAPELKSAYFR